MKFRVICMILLLSTLGWANYFNNLFEGDIAFRDEVLGDGGSQDAFLRHSSKTWAYNTVPYYIDETSIRSKEDRDFIKEVIQDIQDSANCIIFEDISDRENKTGDRIRFTAHGDNSNPGNGCWSYVGKQGGEQVVNLAEECMDWGKIAHEVLHALGQVHEHNRPDRDDYININQTNIEIGKNKNFIKRKQGNNTDEVVYLGAKYDLYSLLHYPSTAWSKDKTSKTITPINKHYKDIGGTNGMTATDIIELNLRYGCTEIAIPIVIDYMHEVENRLEKQDLHIEEKFEQKLSDRQEMMNVKLEEFAAEKQNTDKILETKIQILEKKMEEKLTAEKKDMGKRLDTEIKNLEKKMEDKLTAEKKGMGKRLETEIKNLEKKMEDKLKAEKKETDTRVDTKIKNLEDKMEEKLVERLIAEKKDIDERFKTDLKILEKKMEDKIKAEKKDADKRFAFVKMLHVDPQCSRPYTILSDKWRKIEYGVKHPTSHCDKTGSRSVYISGWLVGWYAFKIGSDYATIPTTPPAEKNRQPLMTCGTAASAWIEGSNPTIGQHQKDVTIYFAYKSTEKLHGHSVSAKVVGCVADDGQPMYLYYLPPVPGWCYAYCAL